MLKENRFYLNALFYVAVSKTHLFILARSANFSTSKLWDLVNLKFYYFEVYNFRDIFRNMKPIDPFPLKFHYVKENVIILIFFSIFLVLFLLSFEKIALISSLKYKICQLKSQLRLSKYLILFSKKNSIDPLINTFVDSKKVAFNFCDLKFKVYL